MTASITSADNAAAILRPNGRTLHQSQPVVRCSNGTATTHYRFDDADIYGDGIAGAHGGSGLSALGGTIRLGELMPHGSIPHALKIVIEPRCYHYDPADASPGFRWPASTADGHASLTYTGREPALEMGSLLALPTDFDVDSLRTEPAPSLLGRRRTTASTSSIPPASTRMHWPSSGAPPVE